LNEGWIDILWAPSFHDVIAARAKTLAPVAITPNKKFMVVCRYVVVCTLSTTTTTTAVSTPTTITTTTKHN